MPEIFQLSFMRNAFLVSAMISVLCPLIGIFLVLRRYSLMGDTLAHASLAGVAAGLLFGANPIFAAFAATAVAGVVIELLRNFYKKYAELILAVVLSLSVGLAITLISSGKVAGDVNSYLFGSVLLVTKYDLYAVAALTAVSLFVVGLLYNQLVFISFDEEGARAARVKIRLINLVFALLVAATVSVCIQIVGVLVLSSLIALPVATALQFRRGFRATLALSVLFSFVDIMLGIVVSYYIGAATGGVIALLSATTLILVIAVRQAASKIGKWVR